MLFKFILFWLLACVDVRAEIQVEGARKELSDPSACRFRSSEKNYNVTDLLECINKLTLDVTSPESGRSTNGRYPLDESQYREQPLWFSLGDILSNLFKGDQLSQYQSSSSPADTASSYYQSNYPAISTGTFDPSEGNRVNILDALSSISRYDDYKCVPRILCEVASGKLPGKSLADQASGFLGNLGKNALAEWLTRIDIAETSPLLNFARAGILGYSNRGDPNMCYRTFPRCPRDSTQLVHYLNNYNGGLFRFFNRGESFQSHNPYYQNNNYLRARHEEATLPVIAKEFDRTGTGKFIINENFSKYRQSYDESFFPNDIQREDKNKIAFPDEDDGKYEILRRRIPKNVKDSESYESQEKYRSFFPEKEENRILFKVRFP